MPADLSLECPVCGKQNSLPVDSALDTFTCDGCGQTSPVDASAGHKPAPDYLVGEVISDCKIVEKVGEGGFGSVYRATDQNLQRTVALKVMLQSLTTNQEFVQKFIREAVTAAQLNHPNIVSIHKVGRDERRGLHYLIMEFVEGRTLTDLVKEKGVLKVEEAVPIMLQTCDALATAHEHNIVHRDIKPENLMLDANGVVKITDFGLAKSLAGDAKTTKVMGTPHYMSPEQFEGKAVDGRSDIYSLGVTFYYLLSKERPYEGQNTVQIIYAILTQQPRALTELNKDVHPDIWTTIQKMIAKKAEDRYQTLRDTITDLRRFTDRHLQDRSQCPGCGARNPKGRKFCRGCGAALLVRCPSCGSQEAAGATTCSQCGADMARLLRIKKAVEAAARFKSLGDLRRAADAYRQVVELDPTNAEATAELDRLSGTLSEVDRVRSASQELLRTGDIQTALEKVEELLRRYPMAGEVREHRDELRHAMVLRRVNHMLEKAEAAAAAGDSREALDVLDQALRVDPAREDVRARRTELAQRMASVTESRQKAAQALAAGRFEEAFALASEVLKVTPSDTAMEELRRKAKSSVASVDEFVRRGKERLDAKKLADALSEFEAALTLRPGDASLFELVESTRGRIAQQRERLALCRRLMADRRFDEAVAGLREALEEQPDDTEAKSLLAACEKGREEAARTRTIDEALREAERLEKAGDFAAAITQYDRVLQLDPGNADAPPRREQIEMRMRGERDIRELANEHLQDGRYAEAVQALDRLRDANPARAQQVAQEISDAKRREEQVRGNLKRAEESLERKEYRRALEAATAVVAVAPRHPRANAIKKDAEKAVAAIDRFLAESDRLMVSEMFDEALDALDKARERGATPEEYKPRRDACEQGRLALLKTDATRSLVAKDYEAAIAAYEQVLEVARGDSDAAQGKKSAERRIRILTTEPLALRLGAGLAVVMLLGLVDFLAVLGTAEAKATRTEVASAEQIQREKVVEVTKGQLAPEYDDALAAETLDRFEDAAAAFERELKVFPGRSELETGREWNRAMAAALAVTAPAQRLESLGAARALVGEAPEIRIAREDVIGRHVNDAVAAWFRQAAEAEERNAEEARTSYIEIEKHPAAKDAPEMASVKQRLDYLDKLALGESFLGARDHRNAAEAYIEARRIVAADAARREAVERRIERLRGDWMQSLRDAESAAKDDAEFYDQVVAGLASMVRVFEPLGITREKLLEEYGSR